MWLPFVQFARRAACAWAVDFGRANVFIVYLEPVRLASSTVCLMQFPARTYCLRVLAVSQTHCFLLLAVLMFIVNQCHRQKMTSQALSGALCAGGQQLACGVALSGSVARLRRGVADVHHRSLREAARPKVRMAFGCKGAEQPALFLSSEVLRTGGFWDSREQILLQQSSYFAVDCNMEAAN